MTIEEMRLIIANVDFPEYDFCVQASSHGFIYLQAAYFDDDTVSGKREIQKTRRWPLSPEMSESEIVSTAFKCALTSMEHKTREWFTYKGGAIYGPHYNVNNLLAVCGNRKERP